MTPFMSMKRKCFRNIFVFAVFCFILLCFVLPSRSHAQTGSEEYYQQMDIQVKNSSAAAQDCAKEEKKRYENAVNWFPKIRNKDSFAYYSCQPMHSAQETPPKQCCDTYYATRNKPGMGDEAWYVLQECGWREETKKRKEAYYKKAEMCLQKDPSVKVQAKKWRSARRERIPGTFLTNYSGNLWAPRKQRPQR